MSIKEKELCVKLNRIFFSTDFKTFAISKLKYLPNGVTIHPIEMDDGYITFMCSIVEYGVDKKWHLGCDEYSLEDCCYSSIENPKIMDVCVEYLKINYPTLYILVHNNITY